MPHPWLQPTIALASFTIALIGLLLGPRVVDRLPFGRQPGTPNASVVLTPRITLHLRDRIGGWELDVANDGDFQAQGVVVEAFAWAYGSPGVQFQQRYQVQELNPRSDTTIPGAFDDSAKKYPLFYTERHSTISGYLTASCKLCPREEGWAFSVPYPDDLVAVDYHSDQWRLAEFTYPDKKPSIGQCVDFPLGVCRGLEADGAWKAHS